MMSKSPSEKKAKSPSKKKAKSPSERMRAYREAHREEHSSEEFRRKEVARKKKAHKLLSKDKLEASRRKSREIMRSRRLRKENSNIVTAVVQMIIEDVIDKSKAKDLPKT